MTAPFMNNGFWEELLLCGKIKAELNVIETDSSIDEERDPASVASVLFSQSSVLVLLSQSTRQLPCDSERKLQMSEFSVKEHMI